MWHLRVSGFATEASANVGTAVQRRAEVRLTHHDALCRISSITAAWPMGVGIGSVEQSTLLQPACVTFAA